jgi:hypothetical protein
MHALQSVQYGDLITSRLDRERKQSEREPARVGLGR